MARLEVGDGRSIYYEYFPGAKGTVVLLHGWGMGVRVWDSTATALRNAGYGVAAIDFRGSGLSDKDFPSASIADIAGDVIALIDKLALAKPILSGWSTGAAVALDAADRLGQDGCRAVIMTSAATPRFVRSTDFPYGGTLEDLQASIAALETERPVFLRALTESLFARPTGQPTLDWIWSIFMQTTPVATQTLTELGTVDQRHLLASLDIPVLILIGGKDTVTLPEVGREAVKLAKHGILHEFEECGHTPFIEDGAAYQKVVLDFLQELG